MKTSTSPTGWTSTSAICAARSMNLSSINRYTRYAEWVIAWPSMKRIRPLRARLALSVTALILAFLAAFGGGIYFTLSRSLYTEVEDNLSLSADQVLASLYEDNGSLQMLTQDPNATHLAEFSAFTQRGVTLIVLAAEGEILESVGPYRKDPVPVSPAHLKPAFQTIPETDQHDPIRVYILPILEGGHVLGWIQSMQSLGGAEEAL